MARLISKHFTTETAPKWVADSTEEVDMEGFWTRAHVMEALKATWLKVQESMDGPDDIFEDWLGLFIALRAILPYVKD